MIEDVRMLIANVSMLLDDASVLRLDELLERLSGIQATLDAPSGEAIAIVGYAATETAQVHDEAVKLFGCLATNGSDTLGDANFTGSPCPALASAISAADATPYQFESSFAGKPGALTAVLGDAMGLGDYGAAVTSLKNSIGASVEAQEFVPLFEALVALAKRNNISDAAPLLSAAAANGSDAAAR
eukprot:4899782-Prymnesium_polylepis.1